MGVTNHSSWVSLEGLLFLNNKNMQENSLPGGRGEAGFKKKKEEDSFILADAQVVNSISSWLGGKKKN